MTTLFIPGIPAPQGSKSFKGIRGGKAILVESSAAVGPWRERIAWFAQQIGREPVDGPVGLVLHFTMPRPASAPKTRTPPAIKRPDLDKLTRAVLDALTGVWWRDDAQVTDLAVYKRLAAPDAQPGVSIEIRDPWSAV